MKRNDIVKLMQQAWKNYLLNAVSPDELNTRQGMFEVLYALEAADLISPSYAEYSGENNKAIFECLKCGARHDSMMMASLCCKKDY